MNTNKENSRRKFILNTAKGTAALTIGLAGMDQFLVSCNASKKSVVATRFKTGFSQQPLPYSYTSLENVIDAQTMEIHYSKHAAAYTKNLNEAATAEGVDMSRPLEDVLAKISRYTTKMRNNAGGHYNHEMFWQCMRPKSADNRPTAALLEAIEKEFSSFANFKSQFSEAAKNRFGSGWAWLYINASGKLQIGSSPNQDNPLMDASDIKGFPVLGLDVWEHAYYLKYQNKRADYVDNWWNVVNWNYVQSRYQAM